MIAAAPLLVLSAPGSEGSRLAAMLGRHPEAYGFPELNLQLSSTLEGFLALVKVVQGNEKDGLLRCVAELYCGGQGEAGIAAAYTWLARRGDWNAADMVLALSERVAPRLPVLSESALGWRPHDIEGWLALVPDARVLHLVRHPRPSCAEVARRLHGPLFVPPDYKDYGADPAVIDPQLAWYRINHNIDQALAPLPQQQVRRLQVEELFLAPERTLGQLCDWAGLPFTPAALQRMLAPERGPYAAVGPQQAPYGLEPGFYQSPQFTGQLRPRHTLQGAVEWRPDGKGFAAEVVALAEKYGYR